MTLSQIEAITKNIKILHVDDDENIGFYTKHHLEGYNSKIRVDFESSPYEALERFREQEFDCIISDFLMPQINGIQLAERIRKISDIPVIIYTGQGSEEVAEAAFKVGVDDYLRKEMDPSHYQVLAKRTLMAVENHRVEKIFQRIAEKSFDVIFTANQSGVFTYISPAITRISGYQPGEIIGKSFRILVDESDFSNLLSMINPEVENINNLELKIVKKDGSTSIMESNITIITNNKRITGFQGIARDISERKKTEEELKNSREHFRTLFNVMVDPVVIVDKQGVIIELSDGVERVTGFNRDELLHHNFMSLNIVSKASKRKLFTNLIKQVMGLSTKPYLIEVLTKNREKLIYEINAATIDYQGKKAIMAIFRDKNEPIED